MDNKKFKIVRLENNKRLMIIRVCAAASVAVLATTFYQWTQTPQIPKNK